MRANGSSGRDFEIGMEWARSLEDICDGGEDTCIALRYFYTVPRYVYCKGVELLRCFNGTHKLTLT